MPATEERPTLRLVTYMCPSHPVEMFETIMAYLEEEVKVKAVLQYESRHPGPLPDREDPFEHDLIDLAFMSPAEYLKLHDNNNQHAELLPVAAVFKHSKNTTESADYYSDIIVHTDTRSYVNALEDLRGCQWAYNHENSLSGYITVLKALKDIGEGSQFFGNTLKAGSHLACIKMVQQKQAEAAAVDANVLAYNQKKLPDYGKDISVLTSLGPLPPYPIVISKKVSGELKSKIVEALLKATKTRLWGKRLEAFGIVGFQANHPDKYFSIRETYEVLKNKRLNNIYY
ncbi:probable ABC transporter phosphonate/phosphite binding protein PhnD2 isoform X2 [Bemisia tabaci]